MRGTFTRRCVANDEIDFNLEISLTLWLSEPNNSVMKNLCKQNNPKIRLSQEEQSDQGVCVCFLHRLSKEN